ncbi:MAG: DUF4423 domain-containing protein [Bdellovibrionota bacterium]
MNTEIKRVLLEAYEERKLKNSRYSLRSFAKYLKLPPSTVVEIMNTARSPSKRVTQTICERLFLNPEECLQLLNARNASYFRPENTTLLDMDTFHLISSALHIGLLTLIQCDEFKNDSEWMAERLNSSSRLVEKAIERLLRLKLVVPDKKRGLKVVSLNIQSSDGIKNMSLRKSHAETLDLAKESLMNDPVELRSIRSMTMAIDPNLLPEAEEKIKKFQEELCEFLESGKKKEVYRMNINLFPLTRVKFKKGDIK